MPTRDIINRNDPWGPKRDDGPPDLDQILKGWQQKLNGLFGGKGGSSGGSSASKGTIGAILGVIVLAWAVSGFYIVRPAEESVIFRFGKYTQTVGPGLHWIARIVEHQKTLNVEEVNTSKHQGQMLTKDNTIVSVELAVQYKIGELNNYLFNVTNPVRSLQQATESAMRQVIGHSTLDETLTSGRELIRQQIKTQIQKVINERYEAGVEIVDVAMQPAKAPEQVKDAFDDAIKAQEDQQREINKAQAYAKRILPVAEGQAKRILAEANAYKEQVILQAYFGYSWP